MNNTSRARRRLVAMRRAAGIPWMMPLGSARHRFALDTPAADRLAARMARQRLNSALNDGHRGVEAMFGEDSCWGAPPCGGCNRCGHMMVDYYAHKAWGDAARRRDGMPLLWSGVVLTQAQTEARQAIRGHRSSAVMVDEAVAVDVPFSPRR